MQQDDEDEDEKCSLCGFKKSIVEVCPKTFKKHTSSETKQSERATTASGSDEKCELCGFKKSIVEVCPKTFKPHATSATAEESKQPDSQAAEQAVSTSDEKCELCGFKKSIVEVCPKTFKPHVAVKKPPTDTETALPTESTSDEKCELCGFKKSVVEVCPKTFKPHVTSSAEESNRPTTQPTDGGSDEKCELCGFKKSVVEVCPKTFKPHVTSATVEESKQPDSQAAEQTDSTSDEKCELCGFKKSVVEVCPKTFKPHVAVKKPPADTETALPTESTSDEKCELCGFKKSVVEVCPKTFKPHVTLTEVEESEQPTTQTDSTSDEKCELCGFKKSVVEVCPKTFKPHVISSKVKESKESSAEICQLCGLKKLIVEVCPKTFKPHESVLSSSSQECDEEDEDEEEPSCQKCGFSISMTDICPETNLPHEKDIKQTAVPSHESSDSSEEEEEEPSCTKCGFSLSMTDICPETNLPHEKTTATTAAEATVSDSEEEEEEPSCDKCGFSMSMTDICPETNLPHNRDPVPNTNPSEEVKDTDIEPTPTTDGKCNLCGFTVTVVETCPKTLKPHILPKAAAAVDGKCGLCGFTLAIVEVCPKTLKPHIVPEQKKSNDGKCGLCGFNLAVVEICPSTLKPHVSPTPTPTTDGKCNLCGFTVSIIEVCPKTLQPHVLPQQPPAEPGKCGLCGFTLTIVEICPKTLKPHISSDSVPEIEEMCRACGLSKTKIETCPETSIPHNREVASRSRSSSGSSLDGPVCGKCEYLIKEKDTCPITDEPHILKESDIDLTVRVVPPSPADTSFDDVPKSNVQTVVMRIDTNPWERIRSQLNSIQDKAKRASWKQSSPVATAAWKQKLKNQIRSREPTPGLWSNIPKSTSKLESDSRATSPASMQLSADSAFSDISDGHTEEPIPDRVSMTEEDLADELIAIDNSGYINKIHNPVVETPVLAEEAPSVGMSVAENDTDSNASQMSVKESVCEVPVCVVVDEEVSESHTTLTAPKHISDTAVDRYTELIDKATVLRTVSKQIIPTLTSELEYLSGGMESSNQRMEEAISKHTSDPTRNPSLVKSSAIAWLLDEEGVDTPPEIPLPAFDSIFTPKRVTPLPSPLPSTTKSEIQSSSIPSPVPHPADLSFNTLAPLSWEDAQRILFNQVIVNREGSFEEEEKVLETNAFENAQKAQEREDRQRERMQRIIQNEIQSPSLDDDTTTKQSYERDTETYSDSCDQIRYSPSSTCSSTVKTKPASCSSSHSVDSTSGDEGDVAAVNPAFNYLYSARGTSSPSRSMSPYQCVSVEKRKDPRSFPTTPVVQKPDVIQLLDVHSTWVSKTLLNETIATQTDVSTGSEIISMQKKVQNVSSPPSTAVISSSQLDRLLMTPTRRYQCESPEKSPSYSSPVYSSNEKFQESEVVINNTVSSAEEFVCVKQPSAGAGGDTPPVVVLSSFNKTKPSTNEVLPPPSIDSLTEVVSREIKSERVISSSSLTPESVPTAVVATLDGYRSSNNSDVDVEIIKSSTSLQPDINSEKSVADVALDADRSTAGQQTVGVINDPQSLGDEKCTLCGFKISIVEVCPKTLKPHNADGSTADQQSACKETTAVAAAAPSDDEKCTLCGFKISIVEVCPKTLKPHHVDITVDQTVQESSSPPSDNEKPVEVSYNSNTNQHNVDGSTTEQHKEVLISSADEKCTLCGFKISIVEVCPKTLKPHNVGGRAADQPASEETVSVPADDEKCALCGFKISIVEVCPKTLKPHKADGSTADQQQASEETAVATPADDEKCTLCGFKISIVEVCPRTLKPHNVNGSTAGQQSACKETTAAAAPSDDEKCTLCGFKISIVEVCPKTLKPHDVGGRTADQQQASEETAVATPADDEKCTLCGFKISIVEVCPRTLKPHNIDGSTADQQQASEETTAVATSADDEKCVLCGFKISIVEVCPKTLKPHNVGGRIADQQPASEETAPADDEKCVLCGFKISIVEVCPKTLKPHNVDGSTADQQLASETAAVAAAATSADDEKCTLCGFKISIVEVCPKTLKPHNVGGSTADQRPDETVSTTSPDEKCTLCGFKISIVEVCPKTLKPHNVDGDTASKEPAPSDDEKCTLCGFKISIVEVCPKTLKPHSHSKESKPEECRDVVKEQLDISLTQVDTESDCESTSSENRYKNMYPIGSKVIAHGLSKNKTVNGTPGTVLGTQVVDGNLFFQVQFTVGSVALRVNNLRRHPDEVDKPQVEKPDSISVVISATPSIVSSKSGWEKIKKGVIAKRRSGSRMSRIVKQVMEHQTDNTSISITTAVKDWESSSPQIKKSEPFPLSTSPVTISRDSPSPEPEIPKPCRLKIEPVGTAFSSPWCLATSVQVQSQLLSFKATIRSTAGGWAIIRLSDGYIQGKGMYYVVQNGSPPRTASVLFHVLSKPLEDTRLPIADKSSSSLNVSQQNLSPDSSNRSVFKEWGGYHRGGLRERSPSTASAYDDSFTNGGFVVAEGLLKSVHVNGKRGTVLGKQRQGEERLVQVDFDGMCIAVKKANLRLVCTTCDEQPTNKCGSCGQQYCADCTCKCAVTQDEAPSWVRDESSNNCNGCKNLFTVTRRRHHCRACGQLFCATCVQSRLTLPGWASPQKVCQSCCTTVSPQTSQWVPDSESSECALCWAGFSKKKRKHHCRVCGKIFCDTCTNQRARVQGYVIPQRVCTRCATPAEGLPDSQTSQGSPLTQSFARDATYQNVPLRVTVLNAGKIPRVDILTRVTNVFIKLRARSGKDKWLGDEVSWPPVASSNPNWKTTRILTCLTKEVSTLEFRIWNKDIATESYIGDASISVAALRPGKVVQIPIRCTKGKGSFIKVCIPKEPPLQKDVILIRHGQSRWNAAKAAGGKAGIVDRLKEEDHPLSNMGRDQATDLCAKVENTLKESSTDEDDNIGTILNKVEKIYASPLTRATQTAIIGINPLLRKLDSPLELTAYAREKRNVGGRDTNGSVMGADVVKRVSRETTKLFDGSVPNTIDFNKIDPSNVDLKWWNDNAESKEDFTSRLRELNNFIQWSEYKTIMIVGHSHCFRGLVNYLLSPTATLPPGITFSDIQQKKLCNCGMMHVKLDYEKTHPLIKISLPLGTTLVGKASKSKDGSKEVVDSEDEA